MYTMRFVRRCHILFIPDVINFYFVLLSYLCMIRGPNLRTQVFVKLVQNVSHQAHDFCTVHLQW